MFVLLNRIAWLVSFALWFGIFATLYDGWWIVLWLITACICKWVLLPEDFIKSQLSVKQSLDSQKTSPINKQMKEDARQDDELFDIDLKQVEPVVSNIAISESKDTTLVQEELYESSEFDLMLEKWSKAISDFFSTNLLAKLWGILIFLWVLFLLALVYNSIPDWIKLLIWFAIGMSAYMSGVWLDSKEIKSESRILMWVWILINYLVILSGRYMIGDDGFLSQTTTFILLILNTVFAILTSISYKSQTLLIFGFIVAYLNPLLIGQNFIDPYMLVGYTLIVSYGALYLSAQHRSIILLVLSIILGNLFIFAAPDFNTTHGLVKLIWFNALNVVWIWVSTKFSKNYKVIFEILFAGLFFMLGMFVLDNLSYLSHIVYVSIALLSGFVILISGYVLSFVRPYLYSIATAGATITFSAVILGSFNIFIPWDTQTLYLIVSLMTIAMFTLLHWGLPFIHNTLMSDENDSNSFLVWSVTWVLFLGVMMYVFWDQFFPGKNIWFGYLLMAVCYSLYNWCFVQRFWISQVREKSELQNIFYALSGIIVSLIAIATAFIFQDNSELVWILWLFEATLLFFFFYRNKSWKIYTAGFVLFVLGIIRIFGLLDEVSPWQYSMLGVLAIILVSLIGNIKFISPELLKKTDNYDILHAMFHFVVIVLFMSLILTIIPNNLYWFSVTGLAIFMWILSAVYGYLNSRVLKYAFVFIFAGVCLYHVGALDHILYKIDKNNAQNFVYIQYVTSVIILLSCWIYNKLNTLKQLSKTVLVLACIYGFVISTLYIYDIFNTPFAVTIYWWLLAFTTIFYGISKDKIALRTLWLYIITLTAGKIFLYDIWYGFDEAVSRVIALIFVGILLIIISVRYTKRYWNNLTGEFDLQNLFSHKKDVDHSINDTIKDIDVSEYSWVRFINSDGSKTQIKSENLIKITKMITDEYQTRTFESWDLSKIYTHILGHYQTKLPKTQYNRILTILEKFVDNGGSVEFISKK